MAIRAPGVHVPPSAAVLRAGAFLLVCAAGWLVGCGGDDEEGDATTTAPTTATTATTEVSISISGVLFVEIDSPRPRERLTEQSTTFTGRATPGARVSVGVRGTTVRADGTWSLVVRLGPGTGRTEIVVVVSDDAGHRVEERLVVFYEPTPTTTEREVSF